MKRLYITMGLLLSFSMATFAQTADLAAYVDLNSYECLNSGDEIQPYDTVLNQPYGRWGVVNMGPDVIDSDQTVYASTPYNQLVDSGLYFSSFNTFYAGPGDAVALLSYLPVDSIHTLLNIDKWENDTANRYYINLMVPRENLVDSQMYGFYVFARGIGDFDNPENSDTNLTNNNAYVPIMWHCGPGHTGEGIEDMLVEAAQHINIFPNPANNELHFKYGFLKTVNNAIAQVIDMSGRILLRKDLGRQVFGTYEFNMDISTLPAGNYMLEISTGYMNAVGKFTVNK